MPISAIATQAEAIASIRFISDILKEEVKIVRTERHSACRYGISSQLGELTANRGLTIAAFVITLTPGRHRIDLVMFAGKDEDVKAGGVWVETVETPRQRLFRSINMAPGGTNALVRMREDLLKQDTPRRVRLRAVDHDLRQLLQSWFNRGFLQLRRID